MPANAPSSMVEGLQAILTSLAPLDAAPDADPEFLSNLRSMVASKIRETSAADPQTQASALMPDPTGPSAMGAGPGGQIGPPPMVPTPGAMGMGMNATPGPAPGAMGAGAPGPGRGVTPGPAMPDPDSLRRILNVG